MSFNFRQAALEADRKVTQEMAELGRVPTVDFSEDIMSGKETMQEMIGTSDGAKEFLEKITYDLKGGQEETALLYKDIYETQTDPNFPEVMTEKTLGEVQAVFLEKFEGGEIKFGSLGAGETKTMKMHTYAAGMEYNEDIVEYNKTWEVAEIGRAFGKAYNKLLNHLHLNPIVSGDYETSNKVTAAGLTTENLAKAIQRQEKKAQIVVGDLGSAETWKAAISILPKAGILLHNRYDETAIRTALANDLMENKEQSPSAKKVSGLQFIAYNGENFKVGADSYSYPGVAIGEAYLIVPKSNFKEKIKHDLRVDSGDGDLSRLIVSQIVGRTRRGLIAGISGENGVVKIAKS